ncbi:unnamed protein product, partial [Polarella glacialis]
VLAQSWTTVLIFFAMPRSSGASSFSLTARSQLRVRAPSSFSLEQTETCAHFTKAAASFGGGHSSMPDSLLPEVLRTWSESQPSSESAASWRKPGGSQLAPQPLPPMVGCELVEDALASAPGVFEVRLSVPSRLQGGQAYVVALKARSPSVAPPDNKNLWYLEVWKRGSVSLKLAFSAESPGFDLVTKLQDDRVFPLRSLNDAFLTQSSILPVGASFVSLRFEFMLPFKEGQLGSKLELLVSAP